MLLIPSPSPRKKAAWLSSVRTMRVLRRRFTVTRTLVSNMVTGVTEGYSKTLEIVGTGAG